jgi:hypothetical protein
MHTASVARRLDPAAMTGRNEFRYRIIRVIVNLRSFSEPPELLAHIATAPEELALIRDLRSRSATSSGRKLVSIANRS